MEPSIIPLEIDSRQRTERNMRAEKFQMLSRLLKLIEASIDDLVKQAADNAEPLKSARSIYPTTQMYENEWYHYPLTRPINDGEAPHVFYYLRVPDGMITRLVIETQPDGTELRFTVKVDLENLAFSEIGMLMAQINSLTNRR